MISAGQQRFVQSQQGVFSCHGSPPLFSKTIRCLDCSSEVHVLCSDETLPVEVSGKLENLKHNRQFLCNTHAGGAFLAEVTPVSVLNIPASSTSTHEGGQ